MITKVNWDSDFFGYEIGKTIIEDPTEFHIKEFKIEAQKFRLVYLFSKAEINFEGIKLVDKKVIFRQDNISPTENKLLKNRILSFDSKNHDENQLVNLALESGKYSRFNRDNNFKNNEYSKLYKAWILNSINGKLAFDLLIALENDLILGFTTIAKKNDDLADIGLVAVHKAARARGIATELIGKSIERAKLENLKSIQVVTQLDNIPAIKLYTKANFLIKEVTNIYHYWNYDTI